MKHSMEFGPDSKSYVREVGWTIQWCVYKLPGAPRYKSWGKP